MGEVCRQLGVAEQAYFSWKRQYGGLGVRELRELRQLRDENSSLECVVADLSLDKRMLQVVMAKVRSSRVSARSPIGCERASLLAHGGRAGCSFILVPASEDQLCTSCN
ncbi:MAG: transposase [Opitutae bacterium]|nr:transposase [Opitutae bacterium]